MSLIRIINNTFNGLSLAGDEGKPYIQINAKGSQVNYVDIFLVDAVGNIQLCGTLSTWVTNGTVTVLRNGSEITAEQLDQQLLLIDDDDDDDTSTSDTTWIIDPSEGDDEDGTGSLKNPFKSFRCLDKLPKILEHEIKIRPKAGSYDYFPILDYKAVGNGRLVIDASGETYTIEAGTYTIGSVTGVGDPYNGYETATDVTVTPSPGWIPNQYYPRYIHVLTGSYAGYIFPIFKHDVDTIRTGSNWYGLAPGDTFNIVRPPVVITVPGIVSIRGNIKGLIEYRGGGIKNAPYTPTLLMAGIEIRCNSVTQLFEPFKIENICIVSNFCTFLNEYYQGGNNVGVMDGYNGAMNMQQIPATFDNSALDDWYAYTTWLAMHENEPHHEGYPDIYISNFSVSGICCRGGIGYYNRASSTGGSSAIYSLAGAIWCLDVGENSASSIFLEQVDYPIPSQGPAIRLNTIGLFRITGVYIESCTTPVVMTNSGTILVSWIKGNASGITGTYALEIEECSKFIITNISNVTILGSTGAINFKFSNTQHASYPSVGDEFTDGSGSRVISTG